MKRILSFLVVSVMLFLTGCTSEIEYNVPTETPTAYPVVIGETVFKEEPMSVASLSPAVTEMIFALGYGDKLVARSKYCDYPEIVTKRTSIGSSVKPSVDMIINIKPDVLITQSPIAKTDRNRIEEAGIKIVIFETPHNFEELYNCYYDIAAILGGNLTAEAKADECLNSLAVRLSNITAKDNTFAYLMTYDYGTATGDTLAGEILSYFGENVAADFEKYNISPEELIEKQPETIVLSNDITIDGFDAEISELNAVKSGRVIYIDSSCFERPTARLIEEFVASFGQKVNSLPEMKDFSTEITEEVPQEE